MHFGICSYSFHRSFADGRMDIFSYIAWCQAAGFTQLDPWSEHLETALDDTAFLARVKQAAEAAGLPFGCIAVDGAHIYEPTAAARTTNRRLAYRWLELAAQLGATQVRIDAGGHEETFEEISAIVVDGYRDLIQRARPLGIELLIENHWGPTRNPDVLFRLLDAVEGLGLLLDSGTWPAGSHERSWSTYAPYARAVHVKTRSFDDQGNETNWDIPALVRLLLRAGYDGPWGIESVPRDGDELDTALKSLALLKRILES